MLRVVHNSSNNPYCLVNKKFPSVSLRVVFMSGSASPPSMETEDFSMFLEKQNKQEEYTISCVADTVKLGIHLKEATLLSKINGQPVRKKDDKVNLLFRG